MTTNGQFAARAKRTWVVAWVAACLGLAALLPRAARAEDDNERVRPEEVPRVPRAVLERESAESRRRVFYRGEQGQFLVHHTLPSGLRLETRVRRDGSILRIKPTAVQRDVDPRHVGRLFAEYTAKREHRELTDAERRQIAEDLARIEAERHAAEAEAARARAAAEREARAREEAAAHERARRMSEREAAEWFGGRRYERVAFDDLPGHVRRALREESRDTTDVEFYAFRRAGDIFYATQFTTGTGRRVEVLVNEDGRVIDRVEVWERPAPGRDVRDRDAAWDRDRGWDRDRERVSRFSVPAEARVTLDELLGGYRDVEYYRLRLDNRTVYAARYTTDRGRRMESRVSGTGVLIETVRLYDWPDVRDYDRDR